MDKVKFKTLAIGAKFRFDNRYFTVECVKVSSRCYTWQCRLTDNTLKGKVGTVNVEVIKLS